MKSIFAANAAAMALAIATPTQQAAAQKTQSAQPQQQAAYGNRYTAHGIVIEGAGRVARVYEADEHSDVNQANAITINGDNGAVSVGAQSYAPGTPQAQQALAAAAELGRRFFTGALRQRQWNNEWRGRIGGAIGSGLGRAVGGSTVGEAGLGAGLRVAEGLETRRNSRGSATESEAYTLLNSAIEGAQIFASTAQDRANMGRYREENAQQRDDYVCNAAARAPNQARARRIAPQCFNN